MSGFQGFGCCSTLFSPLIRRADIQPSTTTPGALGIKGLHTDFGKGRGVREGGDISEVGNTERNNIEKNRENEREDRMQNKEGKEWTDKGESKRRGWTRVPES